MKIAIIEDEEALALYLERMLEQIDPNFEVAFRSDGVADAVEQLSNHRNLDLIFLDIYLSDGLCFEIFDQAEVDCPIIFTTAYNEYALNAFEVNGIDYLLKPIRKENLQRAIDKFYKFDFGGKVSQNQFLTIADQLIKKNRYKTNFLLPYKGRLIPLHVDDFRYFAVDNGVVRGVTQDNRMFILDESLDELVDQLDPELFQRANRQYLVHRDAIRDIEYYFNGRLALNLLPPAKGHVLVSKAKATEFKTG